MKLCEHRYTGSDGQTHLCRRPAGHAGYHSPLLQPGDERRRAFLQQPAFETPDPRDVARDWESA